jgi:hypothetical protein
MSNNTQLPAEWVIKIDKEAQEKYPYSIQATERAAYKSIAKEYASKLQKTETVLALYKQAEKTNGKLLEDAIDLLEKFIDKYDRLYEWKDGLYREIKTFLDGK